MKTAPEWLAWIRSKTQVVNYGQDQELISWIAFIQTDAMREGWRGGMRDAQEISRLGNTCIDQAVNALPSKETTS